MNFLFSACRFLPVVVLAAVPLLADGKPQSASAEAGQSDCPIFGGDGRRNQVNTVDKNIPAEWSIAEGKEKNIKWSAKLGSKVYGGPVIAGGKVFIGTNNDNPRDPNVKGSQGVLMCFRESDGKFLWQAVHEELPQEIRKQAHGEGIAFPPTVDGDRVYYLNNRGEVVCASVEPKPGTTEANILWSLDLIKDYDVFPYQHPGCSPLVVGDLVYVDTSNGIDEEAVHSPNAPSLVAIDKKTGKVVWKDNSPGANILVGQWSAPAYAEVNGQGQVIFGGGDGWLRAFEPKTGKLIWKFDCNPKSLPAKGGGPKGRNFIVATPVVHDNKVYVGVGQDPDHGAGVGHFWCIDLTKTGDVSPVKDNFDPKAPENKDSALVWHFGGPADEKTAQESGRDYLFGRTMSTCAVHDGLVYVAELAGFLYCLDAKTGQKYWEYDTKAEVWGSPYGVDGKIYLGTGDGDVHVLAQGKVKKPLGKVEVENAVYSTPVAANGVLYVATMKQLYAIANK